SEIARPGLAGVHIPNSYGSPRRARCNSKAAVASEIGGGYRWSPRSAHIEPGPVGESSAADRRLDAFGFLLTWPVLLFVVGASTGRFLHTTMSLAVALQVGPTSLAIAGVAGLGRLPGQASRSPGRDKWL